MATKVRFKTSLQQKIKDEIGIRTNEWIESTFDIDYRTYVLAFSKGILPGKMVELLTAINKECPELGLIYASSVEEVKNPKESSQKSTNFDTEPSSFEPSGAPAQSSSSPKIVSTDKGEYLPDQDDNKASLRFVLPPTRFVGISLAKGKVALVIAVGIFIVGMVLAFLLPQPSLSIVLIDKTSKTDLGTLDFSNDGPEFCATDPRFGSAFSILRVGKGASALLAPTNLYFLNHGKLTSLVTIDNTLRNLGSIAVVEKSELPLSAIYKAFQSQMRQEGFKQFEQQDANALRSELRTIETRLSDVSTKGISGFSLLEQDLALRNKSQGLTKEDTLRLNERSASHLMRFVANHCPALDRLTAEAAGYMFYSMEDKAGWMLYKEAVELSDDGDDRVRMALTVLQGLKRMRILPIESWSFATRCFFLLADEDNSIVNPQLRIQAKHIAADTLYDHISKCITINEMRATLANRLLEEGIAEVQKEQDIAFELSREARGFIVSLGGICSRMVEAEDSKAVLGAGKTWVRKIATMLDSIKAQNYELSVGYVNLAQFSIRLGSHDFKGFYEQAEAIARKAECFDLATKIRLECIYEQVERLSDDYTSTGRLPEIARLQYAELVAEYRRVIESTNPEVDFWNVGPPSYTNFPILLLRGYAFDQVSLLGVWNSFEWCNAILKSRSQPLWLTNKSKQHTILRAWLSHVDNDDERSRLLDEFSSVIDATLSVDDRESIALFHAAAEDVVGTLLPFGDVQLSKTAIDSAKRYLESIESIDKRLFPNRGADSLSEVLAILKSKLLEHE